MLNIPIFEVSERSERVGAGEGFDIFCGLPLYYNHANPGTKRSLSFINPVMSIYWFFSLHGVASRVLYLCELENTERCEDALAVIRKFRNNCRSMKTKRSIPL